MLTYFTYFIQSLRAFRRSEHWGSFTWEVGIGKWEEGLHGRWEQGSGVNENPQCVFVARRGPGTKPRGAMSDQGEADEAPGRHRGGAKEALDTLYESRRGTFDGSVGPIIGKKRVCGATLVGLGAPYGGSKEHIVNLNENV